MDIYALLYLLVSLLWLHSFRFFGGTVSIRGSYLLFFIGALSGPIAGILEAVLISMLPLASSRAFNVDLFLLYFAIIGPVEELVKFAAVALVSMRRRDFTTSLDGLLLAIAASIGFAGGENLLYLASYGMEATLPRLILGNLGHAAFSVFWGYGLGVTLTENASVSILVAGFVIAALFHGAYDYFLNFSIPIAVISMVISGILYLFMFQLLNVESKRHKQKKKYQ